MALDGSVVAKAAGDSHISALGDSKESHKLVIEDLKSLLTETREQHISEQHSLQVNIGLNPTPMEFSRQLNELMKEEEERSKKKALYQHFVDKVEKMFRTQLRKHFRVSYNRIASKWQALEQKHQREWLEISKAVCAVTKQNYEPNRNYSLEEHMERLGLYEDTFEAKAAHYEDVMASKYFTNERHNLELAFRRQMERLQGDWGEYIVALEDDYEDLRAGILGPAYSGRRRISKPVHSPPSRNTWKAKVKQDQVIHTAPVLRPTKRESLTIESHTVNTDEQRKRDLNALNIRFQGVCADVKQQQLAAERMIRRQAMRLKLQLEFELEAKDKIDKHKKKENHAFEHLMDLIKVYLEKRARRKKRREEEKRLQLLEETARAQESGSDSSLGGSDSSFDSIATSYLHQRHGKQTVSAHQKQRCIKR
eukprot:g8768.t1